MNIYRPKSANEMERDTMAAAQILKDLCKKPEIEKIFDAGSRD